MRECLSSSSVWRGSGTRRSRKVWALSELSEFNWSSGGVRLARGTTYRNSLTASPRGFGWGFSKLSNECPRPPWPINSSAVRPSQSSMLTVVAVFPTSTSKPLANWARFKSDLNLLSTRVHILYERYRRRWVSSPSCVWWRTRGLAFFVAYDDEDLFVRLSNVWSAVDHKIPGFFLTMYRQEARA